MKLPSPKAIIFDWDNTLVDTWPVIHAAMVQTFGAMGHEPWTLEQTKERVKKSMRDAFPGLFGDRWEEAGKIYQQYYLATHLEKLVPLPGAAELLQAIKDLGIYTVVVSNKKGPTLRKEVQNMGWSQYFNKVVGSDDAARDKPHLDPVHMAFDKSGLVPGMDVWFIGDSDIDLECAMNAGCIAILYGESAKDHPDYSKTHFQGFPYHAHVHSHAQAVALLKSSAVKKTYLI
jgi:phosphoglycolate phosphatase